MIETELITNNDGSIFHLRLLPGEVSEKIILVGDPGRVELLSANFDSVRVRKSNREFHTVTGSYKGKEISIISTGIGTDNIDIVINEVDAIFNYDIEKAIPLENRTVLNIVRLGTSGGLQPDLQPGQAVISSTSIGFDSVLHYYKGLNEISNREIESDFIKSISWPDTFPLPYCIDADPEMLNKFRRTGYVRGITVSTPGFYAPQGRMISLEPFYPDINKRLTAYRYKDIRILNYEMECSAIYGLSKLLGHKAVTVCAAIGNRTSGKFINDYKPIINKIGLNILDLI